MVQLYKFWHLTVLVCAALAWNLHPAAASCGTATCPLDLSGHESLQMLHGKTAPGLTLQLAFEDIDQDQPRSGSDKVPFGQVRRPDHDEIETENRNVRLLAEWAVSPRWAVSLALPVLKRSHSHLAQDGHHRDDEEDDHSGKLAADDRDLEGELESWNFTHLGDLTAWGRYAPRPNLLSGKAVFSLGLGIGIPTGSTDVRNDEGDLAEPTLQPGRGAWALLFDTSFEYQLRSALSFAGRRSARFFASTFYRINFQGEENYEFGGEWVSHLGSQYPLWQRVNFLGQFVARWSGRDKAGYSGELTDATGGTYLYLSPGLQFDLGQGISLYGYYQIPVHQDVNQVQITSDRNLLLGLGYRFDLSSRL